MYDRERELWIKLIEHYKEMSLLWNPRDEDYTNKNLRNKAYFNLLERYKKIDKKGTLIELKKKLDNMRTTYNREKRKLMRCTENGSPYIPSLWYYKQFSFLDEAVELNRSNKEGSGYQFNRSKNKIYLDPDEDMPNMPIKKELKRKIGTDLKGNDSTMSLKTPKREKERTPMKFVKTAPTSPEQSEDEVENGNVRRETSQPQQPKRRIYELLEKQERFIDTASKLLTRKEKEWEVIGKSIGLQLMDLEEKQRTIANKLISDAIFYASLGKLTVESSINVNVEQYEEIETLEHDSKDEMMYVETLDDD